MTDQLFDRARDMVLVRDVAERGGAKLHASGREVRGTCPLRGCGSKSKAGPFAITDGGRRWKCWSCDPRGGDVVDLEHLLFSELGQTLADAARRLTGGDQQVESAEAKARRERARKAAERDAHRSAEWKADLAKRMWRESVSAVGSPVQTYLEARGIRGPVAARALGQLRFHPSAYHSGHPDFGVFLPAMLGLPMTEHGPAGGVHATYLAPDGRSKTHRSPAKRMIGPQSVVGPDGIVRYGAIWLTKPTAEGLLVVAEGIESTLSRALMRAGAMSHPVRAAAACSLDRLQGFELIDDDGARDVWKPKGDPMRPPFTWPETAEAPWGEIDIATDGDMSPVKVRGRTGRGRLVDFQRDSEERARVCGRLAIAAWRGRLLADSKTTVGASRAPLGQDFNDVIRAAEAAECGGVA